MLPKSFDTVSTSAYPNIDDAIQAGVLDKTSIMPRSAVLAVAGPVDGDIIDSQIVIGLLIPST